jgi:CRP/FNR family transcriptional regulator, cyclic AMP receptor protein
MLRTNPGHQYQSNEAFSVLRRNLGGLNIPVDLVDELIERHIAISFEKGALVFCEGKSDGMLACVLSGYVNIYCPVGDGNRTLVRMAGPGEVIGYPDYVDDKGRHARMFEAQGATKCTVALFSRDHIARLLTGLPSEHLISILTTLNTFWSENLRFFTTMLSLPLSDRLKVVLSDLGTRAGVPDSEGVILIPELNHEDLAEMIGCSRPMISRLIAEMIDAGLLARRGKQYVLLKKWEFVNSNGPSSSKPAPRFEAVPSNPKRPTLVPARNPMRSVAA